MSTLAWSASLATGHGAIDAMHHEFVGLANALVAATDAELLLRLKAVEAHARTHFDGEDGLMKDTAYPSAGCHIDEHAAVLASIAGVIAEVAQGHYRAGRELAAELVRWFPQHTDHMDQSLVRWLVGQASGGAPVVLHRRATAVMPAH